MSNAAASNGERLQDVLAQEPLLTAYRVDAFDKES